MSSEKSALPHAAAPPASPMPSAAPRLSGPRGGDMAGGKQRGVSLGLFAEDVSFDYAPLLQEIAEIGASHVALVVPIYQEHAGSTRLGLHTRLSPSLSGTAEAVRAARRAGLEVMLFPIVRLSAPRSDREWRGTRAPRGWTRGSRATSTSWEIPRRSRASPERPASPSARSCRRSTGTCRAGPGSSSGSGACSRKPALIRQLGPLPRGQAARSRRRGRCGGVLRAARPDARPTSGHRAAVARAERGDREVAGGP